MNQLPSAQDSARIIRPTLEETRAALEEHFRSPRIGWSYDPVRRASPKIFGGEIRASAIDAMFPIPDDADGRSPKIIGKKANREVAHLVRVHAEGRVFKCYELKPRRVALSAEHSLTVSPGFYFVENKVVKIFWLQPRKGYALSTAQMGVLDGLLRLSHFRDDFEDAQLELLDLSAVGGVRRPQVFGREDLPRLSEDKMRVGLEYLLRAYLDLKDSDLRPARDPKAPPPPEPTLFD